MIQKEVRSFFRHGLLSCLLPSSPVLLFLLGFQLHCSSSETGSGDDTHKGATGSDHAGCPHLSFAEERVKRGSWRSLTRFSRLDRECSHAYLNALERRRPLSVHSQVAFPILANARQTQNNFQSVPRFQSTSPIMLLAEWHHARFLGQFRREQDAWKARSEKLHDYFPSPVIPGLRFVCAALLPAECGVPSQGT